MVELSANRESAMFQDDEMKKRRGRSGSLSPFGMQLTTLRGGMPGRSFMGVGSGGGIGNQASGFAFNRKGAPAISAPPRPAIGGQFAPPSVSVGAPSMPSIDFTEADFVPDVAAQVAPSQTSPVSQPPVAPVSAGSGTGTQTAAPLGNTPPVQPTAPQMPSWMTGANPRPPGMPQWMFSPNPTPPGMPAWMTGGGNIPR